MKKTFPFLIAAVLAFPSPAFSIYLVELTTGGSFVISDYWDAPGSITFYILDGQVGLSKEMVRKIRPYDERTACHEDAIAITLPSPIPETGTAGDRISAPEAPSVSERTALPGDVNRVKQELRSALHEALERFRLASKNKERLEKARTLEEVTALSGKLVEISNFLESLERDRP